MTLAILVGAGLGASVWLLRLALVPPRTDLAAAVGRWDAAHTGSTRYVSTGPVTRREQLGRRIAAELAARGVELRRLRTDLELLDRPLELHLVTQLLLGLSGLVVPSLLTAVLAGLGTGVSATVPVAGGLIVAAVLFVLPDVRVRRDADRRRDDLRRALGCYLDLVAMSMAGGRGVPEALPTAARIGRGWAFELLADTISRARYVGMTPWEALTDLGARAGMPELRDLGGALSLVADDGAKIRDSLTARASTMRRRQLAEAEGDAQQADQSMRMAQLVLAVGFLMFIGYPAVVNVLAL